MEVGLCSTVHRGECENRGHSGGPVCLMGKSLIAWSFSVAHLDHDGDHSRPSEAFGFFISGS